MTFYREPVEPRPAQFTFRPGTLVEFLTLGGEVIGRSIVASGDGSSDAPLRLIGDPFGAED